jgi:hypothetical protein
MPSPQMLDDYEQMVVRSMSEAAWQRHVEEALAACGFQLQYHTHDSRRSRKGWPDLIAIRLGERITLVVVELKRWNGKPTPEQERWLAAWRQIAWVVSALGPPIEVITGVWRPQDREQILAQLQPLEDPYA